eukprot:TRINITY_DN25904_c0_g1_i1.p1 TRINITY_DN25904_c0_g1~~TRINITY_DN25904_c0_g1_i1.p1  ORF type:complete len:327 (-),score=53.36 TRINITY_DN25904_c0_g1_i1:228-1208(-)
MAAMRAAIACRSSWGGSIGGLGRSLRMSNVASPSRVRPQARTAMEKALPSVPRWTSSVDSVSALPAVLRRGPPSFVQAPLRAPAVCFCTDNRKQDEDKRGKTEDDSGKPEGEDRGDLSRMLFASAGVLALAAVSARLLIRVPVVTALLGGTPLAALAVVLAGASVASVAFAAAAGHAAFLAVAAVLALLCSWASCTMQEALLAALKLNAIEEIQEACAAVAEEASPLIQAASTREFETNKVQLQVETTLASSGNVKWRFSLQARRKWFWESWNLSYLQVDRADPDEEPPPEQVGKLPPQVRYWSADQKPLRWEPIFQRGARFVVGK